MDNKLARRSKTRLALKKERIRNLVSSELAQAHGGLLPDETGCQYTDPTYGHTYYHC